MRDEDYKKELGKYFLDVSKLIFGGVVLATILKIEDLNRVSIVLLGVFASLLFSLIGFRIIKKRIK